MEFDENMKVITEEIINDRIKDVDDGIKIVNGSDRMALCAAKSALITLKDYLKETDTLTVSRLRPMVDAPRDGEYFMAYCHPTEQKIGMFFPYRYDENIDTYVDEDDEEMCVDVVLGWIPSLTFKPEKE